MRRLLLFDIDGTLLNTDGAARRAFHRALVEVYGETGPIATHRFDGKTDPQIARELLRLAGLSDTAIEAGFDALWETYLGGLDRKSTRLNSSHLVISYAVFCLKKKNTLQMPVT